MPWVETSTANTLLASTLPASRDVSRLVYYLKKKNNIQVANTIKHTDIQKQLMISTIHFKAEVGLD